MTDAASALAVCDAAAADDDDVQGELEDMRKQAEPTAQDLDRFVYESERKRLMQSCFGPLVMLGIDPGLRNTGWVLTVCESASGLDIANPPKEIGLNIYVIDCETSPFLQPQETFCIEEAMRRAGSLVRSMTHRTNNDILKGACAVIERPYVTFRGGAAAASHSLSMATLAMQCYLYQVADSETFLIESNNAKKWMRKSLGRPAKGASHAENKKSVLEWAASRGLDKILGVRLNNHVADAALQIEYWLVSQIGPTWHGAKPVVHWLPKAAIPEHLVNRFQIPL